MPVVLYHAVSPVHVRNARIVAAGMPGWTFRVAYEAAAPWMDPAKLASLRLEAVPSGDPKAWAGDVRLLVMSSLQPRPAPLALLTGAMDRGIPVAAIEESNQVALNGGTVNNYALPADLVMVASEHEAEGMRTLGVRAERCAVTGWPFFEGEPGPVPEKLRAGAKERLGLDSARRVALLTLTALHDAGETMAVRARQLELASRGLPEGWQLAIKPHPIESPEALAKTLRRAAPGAALIDPALPVRQALEASDALLNRGASQVAIEALFLGLPVVVLDTGIFTPFHSDAPASVARTPGEVAARLVSGPGPAAFDKFRSMHMRDPGQARRAVADALEILAATGPRPPPPDLRWELAAWLAFAGQAAEAARVAAPLGSEGAPLIRMARRQATGVDWDRLRTQAGGRYVAHALRALRALDRTVASAAETAWMRPFPPATNAPWFMPATRAWARQIRDPEAAQALSERLRGELAVVKGAPELARLVRFQAAGPHGRAYAALHEAARNGARRILQFRGRP